MPTTYSYCNFSTSFAFNSITSISGIISEIGSQKLDDTSHIYLHGINYKIYISQLQDAELKKFYKGAVLELKINQKRSVKDGSIISAKLIKTKVKSELSLTQSLQLLSNDDLSFLSDINTIEDILTYINQ